MREPNDKEGIVLYIVPFDLEALAAIKDWVWPEGHKFVIFRFRKVTNRASIGQPSSVEDVKKFLHIDDDFDEATNKSTEGDHKSTDDKSGQVVPSGPSGS